MIYCNLAVGVLLCGKESPLYVAISARAASKQDQQTWFKLHSGFEFTWALLLLWKFIFVEEITQRIA